jgi:hypothetical protein
MFTTFRNQLLSGAKTNQFTVSLPVSMTFNCIHLMRPLLLYILILIGKLRKLHIHTHTHTQHRTQHNQGKSTRAFSVIRTSVSSNHVAVDLGLRPQAKGIGMTFLTKENKTQFVVQKSIFITKFQFLSYGFCRI